MLFICANWAVSSSDADVLWYPGVGERLLNCFCSPNLCNFQADLGSAAAGASMQTATKRKITTSGREQQAAGPGYCGGDVHSIYISS